MKPMVFLVLTLTFGCTTQEQWRAAASSGTLGYTEAEGGWSWDKQGHRSADTHSYALTYTIQPGKWWEMQMQAEIMARKLTETQYAARGEPAPAIDPHAKATPHDFQPSGLGRACVVCGAFKPEAVQ